MTRTNHVALAAVTSVATLGALFKTVAKISINRIEADEPIDSGSFESFIHPDLVKCHSQSAVTMASISLLKHLDSVGLNLR